MSACLLCTRLMPNFEGTFCFRARAELLSRGGGGHKNAILCGKSAIAVQREATKTALERQRIVLQFLSRGMDTPSPEILADR